MNNIFIKLYKLTFPFSALGIFFIALGLITNDLDQVYFGIVWLLIAIISFIWKKYHASGN